MNRKLIAAFPDGSKIFFSKGNFDDWCVFIESVGQTPISPKDTQYFEGLNKLREIKSAESIYEDFISLYEKTNNNVEPSIIDYIDKLSTTYNHQSLYVSKLFVTLYATMIAELNKENTKLGKRIKRLGVFKVLMENESVPNAANFMRGMNWKEIDKMCVERGF